jgi:hypothetical protein
MKSETATLPMIARRMRRSVPTTRMAPAAIASYCTCMPLSVPSMEQMTKIAVYDPTM